MSDPLKGTVRRTVLPNGLRVLTEAIPAMRSVSFGIWARVGSRDETAPLAGGSHFLEHLLYKGTARRTALEISAALEAVGGETNAFTTKEHTCYYARVLDQDLPLAIDVMCDVVTGSLLDDEDVETERGVILEEIAMNDDEPADLAHDLFYRAVLGDHPLGRPISGSVESISAMTRDQLLGFYRRRYTAPQLVVTAAGNLEHSAVVAAVREAFARGRFAADGTPAPLRPAGKPTPAASQSLVRGKDTEQANLLLGCPAPARLDERRFAIGVLNNALGGGMSSRLFQEIRERRGLAYSVYSHTSQYADTGLFGVYAGCAPGKADEVLSLAREQLAAVASGALTDGEIERGKGMLKGSLVLGMEDTGSRMSQLGKGELLYGDLLSVDELLAKVHAVTVDEVHSIASELLNQPMSLAVVGPFSDHDFAPAIS
ncbi:MAG: insulinase family protein [Micromonosporaceae bacterium]|nr:insulinase family protein [Micromonosporaceae bacterium]